jgi:hypothetical protein
MGCIRLAVNGTPRSKRHPVTLPCRGNPCHQIQIHAAELLNEEFGAPSPATVARSNASNRAIRNAIDDKAFPA